jgi:hypothetical protein
MEKQTSIVYTHDVLKKLQAEVLVVRDHCSIIGITHVESGKHVTITNGSEKRDMIVHWFTLHNFGTCSCKLFERMRIPCHHILLML